MNISEAKIGLEVVRINGGYTVGQISIIDEIDFEKQRIHTTQGYWVKIEGFEPTSKPYEITEVKHDKKTGKVSFPKYVRK